jgi:hypothetical protein
MRINRYIPILLIALLTTNCSEDSSTAESSTGQGGSMTRFAIQNDYLYVATRQNIEVYNIGSQDLGKVHSVPVGFGLETIFAKGEYLYLGANDAMYIYSIANPAAPEFIFRYSHIESCDPVVVQGNRAYVTLRTGTFCNRGVNALEIIDISDPYHPELIANYPMISPHGLAVSGKYLFMCEGEAGLKVFDLTDEKNIDQVLFRSDFFAFDVIATSEKITVTGKEGIFQFRYPEGDEFLQLLSKIPVERDQL